MTKWTFRYRHSGIILMLCILLLLCIAEAQEFPGVSPDLEPSLSPSFTATIVPTPESSNIKETFNSTPEPTPTPSPRHVVSPLNKDPILIVNPNPREGEIRVYDKYNRLVLTGNTAQPYELEAGTYTIVITADNDFFSYYKVEDPDKELFHNGSYTIEPRQHLLLKWDRIIALIFVVFLIIGAIAAFYVMKLMKVKETEVITAKTALTKFQTMTKTQGMPTQGMPTQIDRFVIQEQLGVGGFATVYKVIDEYGDIFALKVPHFQIFNVPEYRARFKREADIIQDLRHPNIVRMFGYSMGENYTVPYICFEYVEGISLKQHIQKHRILPIKQIVEIGIRIAEALEYAHSKGIVHRDVKPENVMLTPRNEVKLMDLGIARTAESSTLTGTGKALGTPFYFAPEQVDACNIDGRADLYALGVVLYEMLTGHLPFDADRPVNVILKHINEAPSPPSSHNIPIPPGLEKIVMKLMEKKPENRFQSAGELKKELKMFL